MRRNKPNRFSIRKTKPNKMLFGVMFFLLSIISENIMADVSGDLNGFFTSLGYDGNITKESAYQGQAAGYYSGGSVFLRNRVKNIQIMHIDLPSIRSGCGGIDLFNGGFSFVNAQALTEFFQKVMSNAGGYMFNLALETAVPEIAHSMQYIQNIAREVNESNFNSCEMAENLVGGMWPRMKATQQHICKDVGSHRNMFSDWAESRQKCSEDSYYSDQINKASEDPKYQKTLIVNKNLIWEALLKSNFLHGDHKLAEFFMSLSGTIAYKSYGKAFIYNPLAKDRNVIKALLEGGTAKIYVCDEQTKCLNPSLGDIDISKDKALYAKINKSINEIVTALMNKDRDGQGLPPHLKGFLELTKFPILKFINAHLMAGSAAIALSITNYSEAIAKTLLMQYMHEALQTVENSLSGTDYAPEIHKQLVDQIHQALFYVEGIKTESRHDIQELMLFIESSKNTEKEVTSRITGQIKDSFGAKP
ncbi:MAG: conjugal transfer protein TraH [Gammaproteobacteria bacterium]|nr:conjugal transfer protein TraH [Gammaproteobacteria bacterium]